MIGRLFKRWADDSLARENERLAERLEKAESRNRVQQVEIDELAAVCARNLKRVEAETAISARKIVTAEESEGKYAL